MSDDSYYAKNQEARKAYQRDYYRNNRTRVLRTLELRKHLDPNFAEKQRNYNREYYLKNREEILRKRREKYLRQKGGSQ